LSFLSNFAFKFNSRRYSKEGCAWDGREAQRKWHEAVCPLARLLARFEDERRVFADVLVTVASGYGSERGRNYALLHASKHASLEHVVQRLLAAGVDVNIAVPGNGATALHLAAQNGHSHVLERLIAGGADVDKRSTADGCGTALHLAASEGHVDVVQRLIVAGADVNLACTDDGATPLYAAAKEGHIGAVELLIAAR
jgi:ankyrin repeat protein